MFTRMLSTKTSITLYLLSPSPQEGDRQSAATCQVSGCRAGKCGTAAPRGRAPHLAYCTLRSPGPAKQKWCQGRRARGHRAVVYLVGGMVDALSGSGAAEALRDPG